MKVIVTGASKGIGKGIASFLAMDGYEVGMIARSADLLEDLRQSLEDEGVRSYAATADLRDYDQTVNAVEACVKGLGGVDALINNAGVVLRRSVIDISVEEWREMMEININGTFHATKAVLPHLINQGHGRIINISSISGKFPLPGGSGYAASKFAVTGFSLSLFQELRDHGITVSTVYPGSVDSESHRHDPNEDHAWKVQPHEVGQVCRDILRMAHGTAVSEVEIRPLSRPPRK